LQVLRHRLARLAAASAGTVVLLSGGGCVSTDMTSVPQNPHHVLQVWIREPPGSAPAQTATRLVAAFTKATGVKAKAISLYEDFETKLQQQAAVRQLPDVIINDAAQLGTMQVQGWLEQIDRATFPGADQVANRAWQAARGFDGRYYAVPFSAHTFALFVRADWRARLGLPVPRTWADLATMAVAFTRNDPDGDGKADTYGLDVPGTTKRGYMAWYFSTYLLDNGADFLTQVTTGVWAPAINSARAVQAATWLKDMFCRYKAVNPDAIDIDTPRAHDTFEKGIAGIYLTGPYMLPRFVKSMGSNRIEIFPVPAGPSGGPSALAEGENVYLTVGSANRAGQLAFAEFATSAAGQTIAMDGDANGPIVRLPVNTTVSVAKVRQDSRWATFQHVYDTASEYVPSVPNWTPFRQMAADTLNGIMADCGSNVRQRLDQLAAEYRTELANQRAATGR
jgi:multiple sugar transport system substrate-binding protein